MSVNSKKNLAVMKTSILLAVAIGFVAIYVAYMLRLHPIAPFMDSLRFLTYVDDSLSGRNSIWRHWNQGDHRLITSQAITYLNVRFFSLNVFGAALISGVLIFFTALIISVKFIRSCSSSIFEFFLFGSLVFFTLFSLSNWELYSLDLGSVLFLKNFIFICYWIALDYTFQIEDRKKAISLQYIVAFLAPFIILLVSGGWAYPFVLASILSILLVIIPHQLNRASLFIILILLLSLLGYKVLGTFFTDIAPHQLPINISIFNILQGLSLAAGSVFVGVETISSYNINLIFVGGLGVLLLTTALTLVLLAIRYIRKCMLIASAMIFYSILDMLAIAIGRASFDPSLAMAPRYFMDFSMIIIGSVWLLFMLENVKEYPNKPFIRNIVVFVVLFFFVGQTLTSVDEFNKAIFRNESFQKMAAITLTGPLTDQDARILQQPLNTAILGSAIQKKYDLGPFRLLGCHGDFSLGTGFHKGEQGLSWISNSASVTIRNKGGYINLRASIPEHQDKKSFQLYINESLVGTYLVGPTEVTDVRVPINRVDRFVTVKLLVDKNGGVSQEGISNSPVDEESPSIYIDYIHSCV